MAFSDSFGLGNSTLLNLESEENKAFQVKTNNSRKTAEAPRLNANGLDMIDESPTNSKAKSNKSHSRHHHRQNGAERKRKFQKSKSDTTLEEKASFNIRPGGSKSISKDDNYSEFFKSEFSLGDGQKSKPVLFFSTSQLETAVQGITNSAQLNKMDSINLEFGIGIGKTFKEMVDDQLQLENGAGIEGNISEDLKAPVFSEDLQNLLNDSTMNNEKSLKVLQLSDDDWKQSLMLSEFQDPVLMVKNMEGNVPVEEKCENVLNIDDATFICPDEDGKEFAEKTIYCIKNEIQNTLEDEQIEKFNPLGNFCKTPKTNSSNALRNFDSIYNKSKPKLKVEENFLSPKPLLRTQEPYEMKQDLEELKQISAWNLPLSILKEYEKKGINKMFDWQIECLRNPKVLFDHCNLVYSAPTSAGKTLVSEILLIKTILERGKKVIMILPFISVVREKMFYLQDLLTPSGYRVEGFFGGYTPPGGFDSINVAICTIEKANSIVNKLLEAGKLDVIGTVVVDEIHLISDPGRGYILELLLSKVLYMSKKYGIQIQIIAMSATLANVELLKKWLDAELYITNYRPVALKEMIKIGTKIYDNNLEFQREISTFDFSAIQDPDNVAQLCIETIAEGCSVIVFCPSKDWCENLSIQLAGSIYAIGRSGSEIGSRIKEYIKRDAIEGVKKQLKEIPSGLDSVLEKTINFACAFHHAGLTSEERDVIETCFKSGALKIIVATSTLSSGVNLPARRVIIRSPLFGGKQMSSLTYKQMIGRAGRTGKDTLGESILICSESNKRIGKELVSAPLNPIRSCLEMESSTHLKRALLEVISSGVATTKYDIKNFVKCTLLHAQKEITEVEKNNGAEENANSGFIFDSIDFLIEYEFIRLQHDEENNEDNYVATRLGIACLASSMPPTDALILFSELQKSRRCFVLESELHAVYLVTPYSVCYQLQELDWLMYLDLWEKLSPAMKKVGELVGVRESFLVRAMRGQMKLDYKLLQIHKRFYTALALQELVNETPINVVAVKYKCTRGMLQSLQQMASTFAGIVNAFCNSLNWSMLSLIVSQFKERLFFGVHRDLIDLMKLPNLNYKRARALFDFGIKSLIDLANADIFTVEKILHNSMCFDTAKKLENEDEYEKNLRNNMRNLYITGKAGLTVKEAAKMLLDDARQFVQHEIGAGNINWCPQSSENHKIGVNDSLYVSSESSTSKRKSMSGCNDVSPPKLKKDVTPNEDKQKENSIGISTNNIQIRSAIGGNSNENDSGDVMICKKNENSSLKAQQDMEEKIVGITSHQTQSDMKTLNNTIIQGHTCYENNVPISNAYKNSNEGLKVLGVLEDQRSQEESHRLKSTSEIFKCSVHSTFKVQKEVPHSVDIQLIKIKTKQDGIIERNPPLRYNNENDPEIIKNDHDPQRSGKLSPPNSTTYAENIKQNKFTQYPQNMEQVNKLITKKELKAKQQLISKQTTTTASPLPRRSPRNHLSSSTRIENPLNVTKLSSLPFDNDLFMDDSSFEMNSVIVNAVDKIQRAEVKPPCNSLNKSSEEIAGSQEMTFQPKTQSTRFLRSYKDQTDNKTPIKNTSVRRKSEKDQSSSPNFSLKTNKSPSIEISDITLGNSLMQNPIQLNSSHILSISKTEPDALSLNCIQILDVCGSHMLLKNAMKELREAKVLGFSIGIEKKPNKRKPLIGANLLINQVNSKENTIETDLDFPVDDCSYVSGISVVRTSNVSLFFNLQTENTGKGITREMKIEAVRTLVENTELTLQIFDSKEQLKILRTAIPQIEKVCCKIEDPKVANWLLQPDKPMTLANMAHQFAPECKALINLAGKSRGYNSIGLDSNCAIYGKIRSSIEACVTMHILRGQVDNLERIGTGQLHKFFIDLEMPLQLSLCEMEIYGFPTNESALRNLFQQMVDIMKKLETKIYEAHGSKFNLGSSSAVARVVGLHRKSNGRISTSKQILEKIDSPIAVMIMVYRKLNVTLAKTVQPLLRSVFDNRIRGQSITFTSTGRISMQEPNLQNVAKDFEVTISTSEKINVSCRSSFFSPKGRCLISADFCQLEMRILAHLSQDPQLLQVMKSEKDVFTAIAAKWNKVAEDNVSERLRNGTKQICYGIVYGMGMRSLAESLKCNEHEAQSVAEQFHTAYTGIRLYTEKVIKFAKQHGYVETITGRRRYLDNINSIEPQLKSQAERQAVNSTIQGSAADITKSAILRMEKNINKYQEKMGISRNCVHLVLHLHDELIFEVPEDKAKKVAKVLSVTMENCVRLSVPLKVKLKIGKSWGSLREVKL